MALSVRGALQSTALKYGRLVAGEAGLNNNIKWVTIVEILEDAKRLTEGELLITTAYGLEQESTRKEQFIKSLAEQKLAGVAIATGFYLPEITGELIEQADQYGLPLIELPSFLNFSDVTRSILQQVIHSQYELLDFSENIHHKFLQLLLSSKGFPFIAELLAAQTGGNISVYDQNWDLITQHIQEDSPDLTGYQSEIVFRLKSDELTTTLERREIVEFESLHEQMPMVNIAAPITADDKLYGFILLVKPYHLYSELDRIAIGHAVMVCALEFLRIAAIEETECRMQGGFLEEILGAKWTKTSMVTEKAKLMGYNFSKLHNVLILKLVTPVADHSDLKINLYKLYDIAKHICKDAYIKIFSQLRYDSLVLLLEGNTLSREEVRAVSDRIIERWNLYAQSVRIIIGIGENRSAIDELSRCAEEAELAVKFGHYLNICGQVCFFEDLGIFHWLINLHEQKVDLQAMRDKTLAGLLDYDRKHGNQLLETLETYLAFNQNMQQTASKLFIHRHTLKYRLTRIESKTGMDLKNHHHRLQLQLAINIHKFLRALE